MGLAIKNRRDRASEYRHFVMQKHLVEKHFTGFRCALRNNVLECVGDITPSEHCATYRIAIRYKKDGIPEVRIRNPVIPQGIKGRVHIYDNGTLCLYDYREQPWQVTDNLHEKIIPWTAEWLVFYELYLMCGQWLGSEAPHGSDKKTPQKVQKQ